MAPKKAGGSSKADEGKRKVVRKTIEFKKELIAKYESGVRVSDLAKEFGMAKSTVSTILKNKDQLKASDVAKGSSVFSKQRPQVLEEVEKLLLIFINEKQLTGDSISEDAICGKARQLYGDLIKKDPSIVPEGFDFKGSRGWFEKFRRRSGIHSVVRHGEAASSDKDGAEKFKVEFERFIKAERYLPQQVFNMDETGLFWKKMPQRTYITREEKSMPGHKPMKDRLTLLLCGNASGDCKIKPLLIYHSENPRAFKANNIIKGRLPVMWRSNTKAWLTRQFCTEWVLEVFAPAAKKYLEDRNLPLRCCLLMDNAPAHPPGLEDDLTEEFDFIKIKFLPPNTTPLLQPMDQQVIANFKMLYTKFLFQRCFEVTTDTQLTLRDFWKNHFNIYHCITLIDKAWNQVSYKTMNSAWRKLWPDCVTEREFEGFNSVANTGTAADVEEVSQEDRQLINEIVNMGQNLGLEMDNSDVEELLDEHRVELTTEELQHLQEEQKKTLTEDISSDEDEGRKDASTAEIKEFCAKWNEIQNFVELYHPDKAASCRIVYSFNDGVVSHFRKVLSRRQKQVTLDKFFTKRKEPPVAESPQPKKIASETTPPVELPEVIMEEDSPSKN